MTDAISYIMFTVGDKIDITDYMGYTPQLQVMFTPLKYSRSSRQLAAKMDVYFSIETEGLRRGSFQALARIDDHKAKTLTFNTSTDRRAGFFPDGPATVKTLKKAHKLLIRYTTTLGSIRTAHFQVDGLEAAIDEIKNRIEKTRPEGITFTD